MHLAIAVAPFVLAVAPLREPTLPEVQAAAARVAAGPPEGDDDRVGRARAAHWAPQLRLGGQLREDEKSRRGQFRMAPLVENDLGQARIGMVVLAWDFSQVVYAREESQIALAHAHLARLRREAALQAARLWSERERARAAVRAAAPHAREQPLRELVQLTAELDAWTGGLFAGELASELAQLDEARLEAGRGSSGAPAVSAEAQGGDKP